MYTPIDYSINYPQNHFMGNDMKVVPIQKVVVLLFEFLYNCKEYMSNTVLLLTGCIDPNGMSYNALNDCFVRKQHYIDAIHFYLNKTNLPIVFIENSSNDISEEFKEKSNFNRLEILTFSGNDYPKHLGKGFGEMKIIEYAFQHSTFISNCKFIFKITGRYKILNINHFISFHEKNISLDIISDFLDNSLSFSDSRFFGGTFSFFKDIFVKNQYSVDDSKGVYLEHVLSKNIHQAIIFGYNFSFFKHKPRYSGVFGTFNRKYKHRCIYWIKNDIKNVLRYKWFRRYNFE